MTEVEQAHKQNGTVPRILVLMEAGDFGGPARNLAATASHLTGAIEFRIATFIRGEVPTTEFIECLRERQLSVQIIRERHRFDARAIGSIREIIRSYKPHIIQVHNAKSRLYTTVLRLTGQLGSSISVDCYHGETWTDTKQLVYNLVDRWLFRRARNVVVVSESQAALLRRYGLKQERLTVIYNGIAPRPSAVRPPQVPLHVIAVGRLSKEKGHTNLLAAIEKLRNRQCSTFKVSIVGDGPERQRLELEAEQRNIADVVSFVGYHADPTPYLSSADLMVLPSLTEGVPNVLLEAAMYDVPIVATAVGGVPEMFTHRHDAYLVEPGDPSALADALLECVGNRSLRKDLAHAARQTVLTRFTDSGRANQYLSYYRELLSAHARPQ